MQLSELILKINKSVEDLDLISTRKLIEANITILNQNKNLLKSNARELLEFLTNSLDNEDKPLTRQELGAINSINAYASRFDVRGLKLSIKDKAQLLLRKDVILYLNSDAKILLEGLGAITKDDQQ
ncbi:hypothetical protein CVD25_01280 [Bacillus canaveralius]|uniref:Uncharacterized protein n=1 Tax=Bacillus canaveralius TaxID=1403243 RepID=A0A2N5GMZ7_9BACI|nr:hypothetical protein [Bacillus canaveralius]PLR83539.1 hypothetical protein CU635_08900 [Bacillus canaveralius]PLS00725.1 hypothetical protein CVD25_01280 [Bacillus canaveralius]RSK48614.1 hypothetical protein EJA13_16725 [Bacillus canaveralius]